MELGITLSLSIVNQEDDEYYDYPYNHIKPRAASIIIESLYGFEVLSLSINSERNVIVRIRPSKEEIPYGLNPKLPPAQQKKLILKYLEDNYGDMGPDSWMEGDIYFPYNETYDKYELFLDLVEVKFV